VRARLPLDARPPASGRRLAAFSLVLALAVPALPGEVMAADPVIVAAGDIACPDPCRAQRRTADLIRVMDPRAVLTLGDNQYEDGRFTDFMDSYRPTWGRFKRRTYPTPGNHDYHVPGARGYFSYFGRRAHRRSGGMYSVNIGNWHLVSINTGNGLSDRKLRWVGQNLSNDRHRCELAFWHHPRWSSGSVHGSNPRMGPLWRVLFRHGVDVALNGHEHLYERFALMNPRGGLAPFAGIRQFTVGTGGRGL
jgi:acid phosphatase type 7